MTTKIKSMNRMMKNGALALAGMLGIYSANAQVCTTKEVLVKNRQTLALDTMNTRGAADNFFLFNKGDSIYVKFLNGTVDQQRSVITLAKTWEKYANVHFIWVATGAANVRVQFSDKKQNYSQLGTNSNMLPQSEHSLHLDSALFKDPLALRRTVTHEFGHVLGFMHEHSSPISGIKWNKDTMYKEYAQFGWDKDMVDQQVFKTYDVRYTNGTAYDPKSIMHYPIPKRHTMDGYSVDWNTEISDGDKQLAGMMYPFVGERVNEVPRINILEYTTTKVTANPAAGGINICPSFYVKSDGTPGDVYFTVMLFDKNGRGILAKDKEKYNVNGVVGAYKAIKMAPGKLLNANKKTPDDFALFIPYEYIPTGPNTDEILIVFRTYVSDGKDLKSVYNSEPVSYRLAAR